MDEISSSQTHMAKTWLSYPVALLALPLTQHLTLSTGYHNDLCTYHLPISSITGSQAPRGHSLYIMGSSLFPPAWHSAL